MHTESVSLTKRMITQLLSQASTSSLELWRHSVIGRICSIRKLAELELSDQEKIAREVLLD